jgi:predicted component of type VI protein secretion system
VASITYELSVRKGPEEGQVFPLAATTIILGRDPMSDIVLTDPEVSRQHARLLETEHGYSIQDLGSTNGTFVDGRRLKGEPLPLSPGDVITMGSNVTMLYEYASGEELAIPEPGGEEIVREAGSLAARPTELAPPAVTERLAEAEDIVGEPEEGKETTAGLASDVTGPTGPMVEDTGRLSRDVPPPEGVPGELPSVSRAERRRREPPPPPPYEPATGDVADTSALSAGEGANHRNRNIIVAIIVLLLLCCCCFLLTGYYVWGDPLYDFVRFYFIG